ncbi:MAG: hypothetical protein HQL33_05835 [Alphaproteobacteria bacterium]|nr:hypothetical protein [Alphaproteobacteria bacterium]MBF0129491.1 hypothetical protein [Alphaproteobacteria bacterium]
MTETVRSAKTTSEPATDELARALAAVREAMTDTMVERLSLTGGNLMEIADRLNDEDTRQAVLKTLDALTSLNRIGALDTLVELMTLVHASRTALSDSMVERLVMFIENIVTNVATDELATLTHGAQTALEGAVDECASRETSPFGLFATLGHLASPNSLRTLNFMLSFGEKLRQGAMVLAKTHHS